MNEAVSYAKSLGDIPVLIVVLILVLAFLAWTIRQLAEVSKELKSFRETQGQIDKCQDEKIQRLQVNCVKQEDFLRELGGWRQELKDMEQRFMRSLENQIKNFEIMLRNKER